MWQAGYYNKVYDTISVIMPHLLQVENDTYTGISRILIKKAQIPGLKIALGMAGISYNEHKIIKFTSLMHCTIVK